MIKIKTGSGRFLGQTNLMEINGRIDPIENLITKNSRLKCSKLLI